MTDEKCVTVLAFDPGGTTGWCALTVPTGALTGVWTEPAPDSDYNPNRSLHELITDKAFGQIDCGVGGEGHEHAVGRGHGELNIAGEIAGVEKMVGLAVMHYPDAAVVLEEFTLEQQNKHGDLLYPVRVMAGFWCQAALGENEFGYNANMAQRIFINRRVDAKTVVTDARMRAWKLYTKEGQHARDAAKHAYHFLRRCRGDTLKARQLRWLAWPNAFEDPQVKVKPKRAKKQGERIEFLS